MATTYSYQISTTFSNGVNSSKIFEEVLTAIPSGPNLETILTDTANDNIDFIFESALSGGQTTTLESVLSAHDGLPTLNLKNKNIEVNVETKLTNFFKVKTFYIKGKLTENIRNIKILSNIKNDTSSYTARIYDIANYNIIAEATFTNTDSQLNDLGTISNVPNNESIFELQIKSNKTGQSISIEEIILCFTKS